MIRSQLASFQSRPTFQGWQEREQKETERDMKRKRKTERGREGEKNNVRKWKNGVRERKMLPDGHQSNPRTMT